MTEESARLILIAIAGVATLVWVCGLLFVVASARSGAGARSPSREGRRDHDRSDPGWLEGGTEVEGDPAELLDAAVSALVSGGVPGIGAVRIVETKDDEVVFEGLGPAVQGQPAFGRARLRFLRTRTSGRTRVEYAVRSRGRGLLVAAGAVQALGLAAIALGAVLIDALVVRSERTEMRWQVLQMLQAVHFLWPPFLFAGLYRAQLRSLRTRIEAFAGNLAFLER